MSLISIRCTSPGDSKNLPSLRWEGIHPVKCELFETSDLNLFSSACTKVITQSPLFNRVKGRGDQIASCPPPPVPSPIGGGGDDRGDLNCFFLLLSVRALMG